jgi:hypothetical protein
MRLNVRVGSLAIVLAFQATAALAEDTAPLVTSSRQAAGKLIQELGAQLREELAKGGPEGAVVVCQKTAPDIAARISRETGWRVSRVSLKPRNPLLGSPDPWEQKTLAEFDRRAAAGEKSEALEFGEIVDEPAGRFFRYLKAIPVQPLCLTCHGTPETMDPGVRKRLWLEYPHDRATGYSAGQIRGGVTIKQPL